MARVLEKLSKPTPKIVAITSVIAAVLFLIPFALLCITSEKDVKNNGYLSMLWKCVAARFEQHKEKVEECKDYYEKHKIFRTEIKNMSISNSFGVLIVGHLQGAVPKYRDQVQMAQHDLHKSYRYRDFFFLIMSGLNMIAHLGLAIYLLLKYRKESKEEPISRNLGPKFFIIWMVICTLTALYVASWLVSVVELVRLEAWYHRKFTAVNRNATQPFISCSIDGREEYKELERFMDDLYGTCNQWDFKLGALAVGIVPFLVSVVLVKAYMYLHRNLTGQTSGNLVERNKAPDENTEAE